VFQAAYIQNSRLFFLIMRKWAMKSEWPFVMRKLTTFKMEVIGKTGFQGHENFKIPSEEKR